ncbi:MAG: hypothetical protein NC033_03720 [Clostridiales bacterium]|nr:hypothetical protein [Clostridiales bacterium]
MTELEERLAIIDDKILNEQYTCEHQLTRSQVVEYLTHTIRKSPKLMVDLLIQKIKLYHNKMELKLNYVDKKNTHYQNSECNDTADCTERMIAVQYKDFTAKNERSYPNGSDSSNVVTRIQSYSNKLFC